MEDSTEPNIRTRGYKPNPELKPVTFKRMRYKNSPIPYLTELLNRQNGKLLLVEKLLMLPMDDRGLGCLLVQYNILKQTSLNLLPCTLMIVIVS